MSSYDKNRLPVQNYFQRNLHLVKNVGKLKQLQANYNLASRSLLQGAQKDS